MLCDQLTAVISNVFSACSWISICIRIHKVIHSRTANDVSDWENVPVLKTVHVL